MRILTNNIPILPLSTVLFPDGILSLNVFETRYLDMVSACLKKDIAFGICMIADGKEVGKAASSYQIGTLAKIINWGQSDSGVLTIEVLGCQRFKILESEVANNQLITASIQVLEESTPVSIPHGLHSLTRILKNAMVKRQPEAKLDEEQFDDANWVSYRLTEMLSMENIMRQRLLEIDDPINRLHMLLGLFAGREI